MTITVDTWQLILAIGSLLSVFTVVMFTAGKLLIGQFDRRLNERFTALDESRVDSQNHWDAKFATLERATSADAEEWRRIERDFMKFQTTLPIEYQRREDAIRDQSRIESKLDGLARLFQRSRNKED